MLSRFQSYRKRRACEWPWPFAELTDRCFARVAVAQVQGLQQWPTVLEETVCILGSWDTGMLMPVMLLHVALRRSALVAIKVFLQSLSIKLHSRGTWWSKSVSKSTTGGADPIATVGVRGNLYAHTQTAFQQANNAAACQLRLVSICVSA